MNKVFKTEICYCRQVFRKCLFNYVRMISTSRWNLKNSSTKFSFFFKCLTTTKSNVNCSIAAKSWLFTNLGVHHLFWHVTKLTLKFEVVKFPNLVLSEYIMQDSRCMVSYYE